MKIVLLTWHFPPSSEIAGKVTMRLARQLEARGHSVTVVAPSLNKIQALDNQFAEHVGKGIQVIRVSPWPDILAIAANVRKRLRRPTSALASNDPGNGTHTTATAHPGGLHGLLRDLRGFPDFANRWIIPASRAVRRIIRSQKPDVLISVSPYFSAHLAARRAHRPGSGTSWWAWSHDPASGNTFDLQPDNWRQKHIERWEATVVRECDGIAVTTEELADEFLRRFGRRPIVAGCGFDPREMPAHTAPPASGPMVMTHAGTLYGHRTPMPLFEALAELRRDGRIAAGDVRLRLIGDASDLAGEPLSAAIVRLGLGDMVTLEPPVTQAEATRAILDSHVGVVLAEDQPLQVPAKTFDYAGLHRPALALTDGATAALVNRYGLGVVASRATLSDALMELLGEFRKDRLASLTARVVEGAGALTVESQFAPLLAAMESSVVGRSGSGDPTLPVRNVEAGR